MSGNPHPFDVIVVDSVAVAKGDLRSYFKTNTALVLANAAAINATNLTGQQLVVLKSTGRTYLVDPADTTTPDDGIYMIRDANNLAFALFTADAAQNYDDLSIHGADIAAAGTLDLEAATGNLVDVTGNTTVTAITLSNGHERTVRFTGTPTITHGANLVLPGAVNKVAEAGDYAIFRGYATGIVRMVDYMRSSVASRRADLALSFGKQSIWIPAGAMQARLTSGPSSGLIELATNKNIVKTLDFDASTQEFAQFDIRMPKSWNEGTISFIPRWSHPATATNFGVVWGLDAVAVSDNEALDIAFGTAQTSTDTGGTTDRSYEGPESSAITVAGSPAAGDLVMFRIHRDPADGSDTMAVDARLHGVLVLYTTDASNDS